MLKKSNSTSSLFKKNSQKRDLSISLSVNELVKKVSISNIHSKISNKVSSIRIRSNSKENLNPTKSKTVIDLESVDLEKPEEFDLILDKVDTVKNAVSQYIIQLEQRGPKLEDLEASCLKLNEQTKELEKMAKQTKKHFYSKYIKQKYKCLVIFLFILMIMVIIPAFSFIPKG
ncbi:unnamed protein product [Brachionus calyciflorus]|uniref:V-SNARE coiled-coil homology domain-containing protein n=1 Tax=Brachionus calyciflorus TaxID=104777 RepID=A0A813T559_9BILA|nr:unnamed protein product [Brachionus calyciflorus]